RRRAPPGGARTARRRHERSGSVLLGRFLRKKMRRRWRGACSEGTFEVTQLTKLGHRSAKIEHKKPQIAPDFSAWSPLAPPSKKVRSMSIERLTELVARFRRQVAALRPVDTKARQLEPALGRDLLESMLLSRHLDVAALELRARG